MKRIKLKKRKNRLRIRRKLVLFLVIGIGYSALSVNLNILGNITVKKHYGNTLYEVLEKEANVGSLAEEYTGEHQDSFTEEPSKKIYHWYAQDEDEGNQIKNKNNVIFAEQCWQMIRTTDTGGVKLIYNGEPENNQCLDNRGAHVGYKSTDTQSMSADYYYGTSYTYDKTNNVFSLDGYVSSGTIETGQYTCKQTTLYGTCSTLYYVDHLISNNNYFVLQLTGNSHYSQFGKLQLNSDSNSPAYLGYMYNTVYPLISKSKYFKIDNGNKNIPTNYNYYYSDSIDYNTITPNEYTLTNPILTSTLSDYSTLVGKYVLDNGSSIHGTEALYILAVKDGSIYFKELKDGDMNTSLTIGDSYIKNGNTYTLTNPTLVKYEDWYSNTSDYSIYKGKYACDGNNTSCSNIKHIYNGSNPSAGYYYYFDTNYTYSYSEDVTYNNGTYTLTGDIKTFWDLFDNTNQSYLPTHHYTCFENGTSCSELGYVSYMSGNFIVYVLLNNVENISAALNKMFNADDVNQINSTLKTGIDAWFVNNLKYYDSQLEDTIFCNDRSIRDLGAWNPNGGELMWSLRFRNDYSNHNLNCINITDKFSLANPKARLTYPVGLLTYPEANLLGYSSVRKTGNSYRLFSPECFFTTSYGYIRLVDSDGDYSSGFINNDTGVRPAISLKPGTKYISGDGSKENPYIVDIST